jgi:hypothetical protein
MTHKKTFTCKNQKHGKTEPVGDVINLTLKIELDDFEDTCFD